MNALSNANTPDAEPLPRCVPELNLPPAVPRRAFSKPDALWNVPSAPNSFDHEVASRCEVTPVLAAILRARGHSSVEAAQAFLNNDATRHAPDELPDLQLAVSRLHRAVQDKEPILICGDYDVDGLTSTALLLRSLKGVGANVQARVPERFEGYDLKPQDVRHAKAQGFSLIVTADNGIRAVESVDLARELGIDVIITDHHMPGRELPRAVAVVNPNRDDSGYAFKELCGCAVAFKVMEALLRAHWPEHLPHFEANFLEFVAMATVADCMPLRGENRVLVRDGLTRLAFTRKRGLTALMELSRLNTSDGVRAGDVGFVLGPRLNAAGRVARAQDALMLLTSTDEAQCRELAETLENHNRKRQTLTQAMMDEALSSLDEFDMDAERALVVVGQSWGHGLLGLLASRLADTFARPAIALSGEGDTLCGSGRSIPDFDLHCVIEKAREAGLLMRGGGHKGACGLTLERRHLDALREVVAECAHEQLKDKTLAPTVAPDVLVEGRDLTPRLLDDLALLEPCGRENEPAQLMLRNAKVVNAFAMGKDKSHLKWRLRVPTQRGDAFLDAVWWKSADKLQRWNVGSSVDVCFAPQWNEYKGERSIQLKVEAARDACHD